jgi:UDP-N-acetyl-D-mannosaminuronic acid dehydrogenase
LLASKGHKVLGVDLNQRVVDTVNQGLIHIVEPDLSNYVKLAVANGALRASTVPEPSDIYMICVPTPFDQKDGLRLPNMDYVFNAVDNLAPFIKPGHSVILESTSPVGTTQKIAEKLSERGINVGEIFIAYCPERVLPGKIMIELSENDRVVGGITLEATSHIAGFYRNFVKGSVMETDAKTAEMCKLTENSYRDTNIAFANELSVLCDQQGIDVWKLIDLANRHPRVNILQPGVGVGGHCIAVDPWFIVAQDQENSRLIQAAREVNDLKPKWVEEKIMGTIDSFIRHNHKMPVVAILGLSFKPDIDDLRGSPALQVAKALKDRGYNIVTVEPNIDNYIELSLVDLNEVVNQADIFAIMVKHKQFITSNFRSRLMNANVLDFCGAMRDEIS